MSRALTNGICALMKEFPESSPSPPTREDTVKRRPYEPGRGSSLDTQSASAWISEN